MLTDETLTFLRDRARDAGVKKLWLFGSCLEKSEAEAGDIDLAVEGLSKNDLWNFYMAITDLDYMCKRVDIVDMSDPVSIIPYILDGGKVIYEAKN